MFSNLTVITLDKPITYLKKKSIICRKMKCVQFYQSYHKHSGSTNTCLVPLHLRWRLGLSCFHCVCSNGYLTVDICKILFKLKCSNPVYYHLPVDVQWCSFIWSTVTIFSSTPSLWTQRKSHYSTTVSCGETLWLYLICYCCKHITLPLPAVPEFIKHNGCHTSRGIADN